MIPLLVKNVQCATVLSDVLRRCAVSAPGVASACPPEAKRRCVKPLPYDKVWIFVYSILTPFSQLSAPISSIQLIRVVVVVVHPAVPFAFLFSN